MFMTPHTSPVRIAPRGSLRVRSRRVALIGAIVVLGLSACGSADTAGSGTPSTLPSPAVIQIAGSGSVGGTAPMAADAATESSKMMPMSFSYSWSGETPDLTSPAASWFFAPDVAPTAEQAQQLAAAFGITGDVVALAEDMGGGWTVGPTDGSAPSITIARDAMQSWWFSPAWMTDSRGIVADCAVAVASEPGSDPASEPITTEMAACEEPEPPEGVPAAGEAEAMARDLLAKLGGDPANYELETYADEWGAGVTAFLLLDGVRTNLSFNVGYGEMGAITWAGGFLAAPQRGADYPRIGVEAAIQRLNDQASAWMTGYGPAVRDAGLAIESAPVAVGGSSGAGTVGVSTEEPAVPEPAVTEPAVAPDGVTDSEAVPTDPAPVETLDCSDPAVSCEPTQPIDPGVIEQTVIELTTVTSSLEQVWAVDGTVWLLPGYSFGGADGMLANVIAVEDQFLEQTEPQVLPEPMPVETALPPVTTFPSDAATEPSPACAGLPTEITEPGLSTQVGDIIVGMCVEDARAFIEGYTPGASLRVVREDGVELPVTADFQETRVNVAIDAGVISAVLSLG